MTRSPTIYDVAEHAGVSKSLVSLVLRDSPKVSDEKRRAVMRAVAELGYTPSRLAAGLAGTRTRSIGVVIDDFENLWFAPALEGLRDALAGDAYSLSVADAALNAHLDQDSLEVFRSLRVDGVIAAGDVDPRSVTLLRVPTVVLGLRDHPPAGAPVVAGDEEQGGRLATAHLAELGHRRIACVSGPGASAVAREAGYVAEMQDRGLRPQAARAEHTTEHAAGIVADQLFAGPGQRPSAVFAVNDPMAAGVIGVARGRGVVVPDELSVVGYDDSPIAAYGLLSLTTVDGGVRALGAAAGRTLLAMLDGEQDLDQLTLVAPRLVQRGSTAGV